MDDFRPELLKALLDWVNTFDLQGRVTAWAQLEDGQMLWQILATVDPDYFSESLPNLDEGPDVRRRSVADNWIPKWQNLKHIERHVSMYIREECNQLPVLTKRMIPDLKTGARDGSLQLTAKLTMAVLFAACTSTKSGQRMLEHMAKIGTDKAAVIAAGIQELQALDERMAELGVDQELTADPPLAPASLRAPTRAVSGAGSAVGKDSELEQEALLFEANKDRTTLRSQVTKLVEELNSSKARIAQLEEELVEARLHLDDRGAGGATPDEVERLRDDLRRERQYIDRLETDHANAKDVIESLKKRMNRLEHEYDAKQELKDQLQLVKAERDELENKAKANENLKKKIESMSKETKALETVRQELQQAKERLQYLEDIEDKCAALEKVNKENIQTLVNSEQSIFEEKGRRTRLEHENLVLMKQVEQTKDLQYKAEDKARELEDRMREFEANGARGGSLEDELHHDDGHDAAEDTPNTKPLSDGRVSAEAIALQQRVDVLAARLKSMEAETLKQMQENVGLKSDIMATKDEESQRHVLVTLLTPFLEQNAKLHSAETELEELQRRLRETELEMAELRNQLNKKSDIDEEVKNQGLQAEYDRMIALQQQSHQKLRDLEIARDEARSLLYASLTIKDDRNLELQHKIREAMLQQIREQIQQVVEAPSEAQGTALEATSVDIADKVASAQAALDNVKRVSVQQLLSVSVQAANGHINLGPDPTGLSVHSKERSAAKNEVATLVGSLGRKSARSAVPEVYSTARTKDMKKSTWGNRIASLISPSRSQFLSRVPSSATTSPCLTPVPVPARDSLEHFIFHMNMAKAATQSLRDELEKAKQESAEQGSAELKQELENLRRENRLMTSAWYDMTNRLQSNTVVLQRKSEAPKSWLGKQRVVVGRR
ncbi:hypothetical protein BU23DRAFT_474993 [Bimuria novae-zelandiae CBS 107.79]|uniref:HOOK N-terminal domain-containing protein n=1 Tax=Bimuria novae-zelandiae CBS 107.79 TaxID=1447943 RepID=A0A6A5V0H5_9PLEO|nr:hypothetical protein BU23DRAFT_474993 [Bimuria novae-zelandiae CBS 107.79]